MARPHGMPSPLGLVAAGEEGPEVAAADGLLLVLIIGLALANDPTGSLDRRGQRCGR